LGLCCSDEGTKIKPQPSLKKSAPQKAPAERVVKDIRRQTRRHFSAEDKIRIVLDGLRGEDSIADLCRSIIGIALGDIIVQAHNGELTRLQVTRPRGRGVSTV
jgi:hypothetical protein